MAIFGKRASQEEADVPTTSMADIAFLLIVFFMVTTIFTKEKGIKLVLPERTQEEIKVKPENLLKISVNDRGELFVGDRQTDLKGIGVAVKKRLKENPKLVLLIRTHERANYDKMVSVFDEVKLAGATRISLGVIRRAAE